MRGFDVVGDDRTLAVREHIALACRVLHRLGLSPSHLSARLPQSPFILVKTRGVNARATTRADVAVIDGEGVAMVDDAGRALAVGELPLELALHLEIYRSRPDVGAIVHTHQPLATAVLSAGAERPDIPRYPDSGQIRTTEQGVALANALGAADLVHLHQHGMAITGPSIEEIVARTIELEAWARSTG